MILGGLEVPLWLVLAGLAAVLLYLYSTRNYGVFKKVGITGPKPWPGIGTLMSLYGDSLMSSDLKLWRKYGNFIGTYEGTLPVLMVHDAEWLKEAFIKNFSVFTNRRVLKLGSAIDEGLFSINGEHWKYARKILSPEFSSGKLRKMMPAIQGCDNTFVKMLGETNGEPVDIRRKTNLLTLDVISQTAFGVDTEAQTKEDNPFTKNAFLMISSAEANSTWLEKLRLGVVGGLFFLAPDWLNSLVSSFTNIGLLDANAIAYLEGMCKSVIEARKKDTPGNDFIQTLADSVVEVSSNDPDTLTDEDGNRWTRKGLTVNEVIGNALLFLLAGFQTTADTMLFIFYELAMHPDIQQKLYEEIMEVCDTEEITVEQINKLKYLECCVNETMRLYPQGFRFDRMAIEDITIRDIQVPKGTAVTASPWVIHRDPEIWENPEEYDPERFEPERFTERAATSFIPFGIGNRQCIGSRLALAEMKMTIISTLKVFTIVENELTPKRPIQFKAVLALSPEQTIMVSFKERN